MSLLPPLLSQLVLVLGLLLCLLLSRCLSSSLLSLLLRRSFSRVHHKDGGERGGQKRHAAHRRAGPAPTEKRASGEQGGQRREPASQIHRAAVQRVRRGALRLRKRFGQQAETRRSTKPHRHALYDPKCKHARKRRREARGHRREAPAEAREGRELRAVPSICETTSEQGRHGEEGRERKGGEQAVLRLVELQGHVHERVGRGAGGEGNEVENERPTPLVRGVHKSQDCQCPSPRKRCALFCAFLEEEASSADTYIVLSV
mmetsp:Transcript_62762/g.117995  ORF Transcript_62762/g.117995 Transcript_62762/m.117995 type:complete len:260 (+) Transcript_62762:483-1262(+)